MRADISSRTLAAAPRCRSQQKNGMLVESCVLPAVLYVELSRSLGVDGTSFRDRTYTHVVHISNGSSKD